jgi:hypothetical protein
MVGAMFPPPLLLARPPAVQVLLAIVVPALAGLGAGLLLGVSETAYLVVSLVAILGGILAGYDHDGAGEGALRGVCGGMLFGTFILLGGTLVGREAKADLPDPTGLLPVITTILGVLFGAIGGALRHRGDTARAGVSAA